MSETYETVLIERERLTASRLIWNRFRRPMPGTVERLYAINPGLAASGPFLPVGATVRVPIPAPADMAAPNVTPIRLWG